MSSVKVKRALFRATGATAIVGTVSLAVQVFLTQWQKPLETLYPSPAHRFVESIDTNETNTPPDIAPDATVWSVIRNDARLSTFARLVGEFDDIVLGLDMPQAKFTVYAPTDEAFAREHFEHGLPWFYWKFLVGYHMGLGLFSSEALVTQNTVQSFVNADIFFKYRQRISVQAPSGTTDGLLLNHAIEFVTPDLKAVNGYVHCIDRVMFLPDSTTDILRNNPEYGTFRQALTQTVDLAVLINDTSTHVGQTVFAPTNTAFKKLGRKVNRFFFGPGGEGYLKALMAYHIIANRTLFSDVYFQEKGKGQVMLNAESNVALPTLIPTQELNITIVNPDNGEKGRQSIMINGGVRVTIPDIVVMDGVVHGIDTILTPPKPPKNDETEFSGDSDGDSSELSDDGNPKQNRKSWFDRLFGGKGQTGDEALTVEEWVERLQPLLSELRL